MAPNQKQLMSADRPHKRTTRQQNLASSLDDDDDQILNDEKILKYSSPDVSEIGAVKYIKMAL